MSSARYWHEEKFSVRKVSEMTSYAFVLDANGKPLAPAKEQKAWFLIRKKRAALVSKYPMVIQLKKEMRLYLKTRAQSNKMKVKSASLTLPCKTKRQRMIS